jgi:deazaflavin-dependent oxidoreductase (nitroreductase family)
MAESSRTTRLQVIRPFTTHVFDRFSRHFAHRLPGFAIIAYRGRKTGKAYRTPMNVFKRDDSYIFALTYGPDVQWVKNVLAAGKADLHVRGRHVHLTNPELFADPKRRLMPLPVRFFLGLMRVSTFLRMTIDAPRTREARRLPSWVPYFNKLAVPLLRAGVPMGPDVLLTVRGRSSGLPRTTPVTICETGARRGVISPFGEVQWVRNLRKAGRATIGVGRRREEVVATELHDADAAAFIRDVLAPHARRSRLGGWFVRTIDKIDVDHPEAAAVGRPVFEIHRA